MVGSSISVMLRLQGLGDGDEAGIGTAPAQRGTIRPRLAADLHEGKVDPRGQTGEELFGRYGPDSGQLAERQAERRGGEGVVGMARMAPASSGTLPFRRRGGEPVAGRPGPR